MRRLPGWPGPALTVEDRLLGALAGLRLVVLLNAVALNLYRAGTVQRPVVLVACLALMVVWSALATWAYAEPRRRGPLLLGTDLAVAAGLLLSTPLVKGDDFTASVPGFWVMAALLAWAVRLGAVGGLVAGVALAACDVVVRPELTQTNYGNVFLLLIGGPVVGFMAASLQEMSRRRDEAERAAAAAAERARLARAVHDGVLQVLALVQRRGAEAGGGLAELGRLAGEQEAVLRALVREQDAVTSTGAGASTDLAAALAHLGARPGVSVATPGGPVPVPSDLARELVAAVAACLDNVARHVGPRAPAWVLLQADPRKVEVSVRDEGPGVTAGRLEQAVAEGRLGISESVRGRVRDLGGTAELTTGLDGTTWELAVPLPESAAPEAP